MKTVKKILAILLTAIFAFSFVACSKDSNVSNGEKDTSSTTSSSSDASSTDKASSTDSTSTGEKVNITYTIWGSAEEGATTQTVADQFNASQDKIEVTVEAIPWESYMTTLNTRATAEQLPDTGMLQEQGVIQWSSEGMLTDASSMFGSGDSKPLDSLAFKYNGQTVAYASSNEILILYYNKDMFDKAGIAYPPASLDTAWTWDEFVDAAAKLTIDVNGKHPGDDGFDPQNITQYGCMVENLAWQLEAWVLSNGGSFYSEDGSEVTIDSPESIGAIQKIADLYLVNHVAPLSVGQTDDGISRSIIAGTVAMSTNGTWNVGTCLNTAKDEGLNYGVAVLPYMKNKVTINTSGASVVFSQTKHPAEAMEWIKWYCQEENSWNLISSGIWMPRLDKYYKDETFTHKWVDNPNFPPYDVYKTAVVDYAMSDAARPAAWFYTNHTLDFNALLTSILGDVWTGQKTAQEAITENIDALKAANAGE